MGCKLVGTLDADVRLFRSRSLRLYIIIIISSRVCINTIVIITRYRLCMGRVNTPSTRGVLENYNNEARLVYKTAFINFRRRSSMYILDDKIWSRTICMCVNLCEWLYIVYCMKCATPILLHYYVYVSDKQTKFSIYAYSVFCIISCRHYLYTSSASILKVD